MRIIGAMLAAAVRVDAFLLWDSADGRAHLNAIVQNCHREEGACDRRGAVSASERALPPYGRGASLRLQ